MAHGDNQGLIMPPKIAPIQVIIVPIKTEEKKLLDYCNNVKKELEKEGIRVKIDSKGEETVGYKFNQWELRGVPIRLEVGLREMEESEVTVVRRDTGEKFRFSIFNFQSNSNFQNKIKKTLDDIQSNLFERSKKFLEENTREVETYMEFKDIMETKKGFIKAFWCESPDCEKKIKEETKASTRCLPFPAKEENGKCIYCGEKAIHKWIFAQSY